MDLQAKTVSRRGLSLKLSPTSWQLLEVLMRAYPGVVTKQKLEAAIWGDTPPDSDSLKVHMFHLRKAVDAPFHKNLIHTISGHGFALRNET